MRTIFDYLVGSSAIPFGLAASGKATVLLLTAALAGMALRRHSAAARHLRLDCCPDRRGGGADCLLDRRFPANGDLRAAGSLVAKDGRIGRTPECSV